MIRAAAVALLLALAGCASAPYYSGTPQPHFAQMPCNADNCGKPAWR